MCRFYCTLWSGVKGDVRILVHIGATMFSLRDSRLTCGLHDVHSGHEVPDARAIQSEDYLVRMSQGESQR